MTFGSERRARRGFTLIESMIAMVLLTLAFLTMGSVVPIAFGFASRDGQRVQAIAAGQAYLDQLRYSIQSNGNTSSTPAPPTIAVDQGDSYANNGNSSTVSSANFTITPSCPLASGSTYRWDCTVTVTWNDPSNNPRTVTVESYVTSEK